VFDDGQLIQQVRSGDTRAFEALYDRYKGHVYRTAVAITNDPGAAEDILQDCFLRLHANIDRLDGSTPISPWLHRVTVNLSYNYVARRKRSAGLLDAMLDRLASPARAAPDHLAESSELAGTVRAAIDHLSLDHRIVVILFYLGEFSLEEIAYILDCPVGTVKSRLYYARQRLRQELRGEEIPSSEVSYGLARSSA
jgi:RNA polymerase sigma-70 factor (ECF subfamily)